MAGRRKGRTAIAAARGDGAAPAAEEPTQQERAAPLEALGSRTKVPGIPALVFDWEYYSAMAGLPFADAGEALVHFAEAGMFAKIDPSPLVSTEFVLFWAHLNGSPIQTADEFFIRLLDIKSDSETGWSPRMVPEWIRLQLGQPDPGPTAIIELLALPVPEAGLSPHPGLRPIVAGDGTATVADFLAGIDDERIRELSLVDLAVYVGQHKDLAHAGMTATMIFDHVWCHGLRQNRLSYLGTKAPRRMNHLQLLRTAAAQIIAQYLAGRVIDADLPRARLPSGFFNPASQFIRPLEAVLNYDPAREPEPPSLAALYGAHIIATGKGQVLTWSLPRADLSRPAIQTGAPLIDTDLLREGAAPRSRRIVYSVNLGLYDDMPEPPALDDCDYYIITDARRIPSYLPWRMVRPTLAERDRKRLCLWYKTHPHLMFPGAEHSLWIDANLLCLSGCANVVAAHETLSEVATFQHPDRNCVYEEAKAVIDLGLDQAAKVNASVERMKAAGMPQDFGLYETNVLYAKPSDYRVRSFFDRWWQEIFLGSRRDQMSFTFAAFLSGVEISRLDGSHCAKDSRFFRKRPHRDMKERTA